MLTQYNQQTAHLLKIVNVLLKTSYLINHEVDLIKRNKNKTEMHGIRLITQVHFWNQDLLLQVRRFPTIKESKGVKRSRFGGKGHHFSKRLAKLTGSQKDRQARTKCVSKSSMTLSALPYKHWIRQHPIYTPGWRKALWEVSCPRTQHKVARARTQTAWSGVQRGAYHEATAPQIRF